MRRHLYNAIKGLEIVKGKIPLKELILALKEVEKEYVSRQLWGDKSDSAKLWRKLRKVKDEETYERVEQQFFEKVSLVRRTAVRQELYWKIVRALDVMYFRNTLISNLLMLSRVYYRFVGRGNKDAIINPYEWIPPDSVFWTQVPPWWWYGYTTTYIDLHGVPIESKHIIDHINRILELNTHAYRVFSALRTISALKPDKLSVQKLITHIAEFLKKFNTGNVYPHYIAVWLIGAYSLAFSKLGFAKTTCNLIKALAEVINIMQDVRKYVEIQYNLKYEDDLGFMFSIPKAVEIMTASSALSIFDDTSKVKEIVDKVVREPASSQIVMLQVRAGAWYVLNGYYEEGQECLLKAEKIMSPEKYPHNTKSVYLFGKMALLLAKQEYEDIIEIYLPMLKEVRSDPANVVIYHIYSWIANIELGNLRKAKASASALYAYASRQEVLSGIANAIRWFMTHIQKDNTDKLWLELKEKIISAYYRSPIETNIERGVPLIRYVMSKITGRPLRDLLPIKLINPEKLELSAKRPYMKSDEAIGQINKFLDNIINSFKELRLNIR